MEVDGSHDSQGSSKRMACHHDSGWRVFGSEIVDDSHNLIFDAIEALIKADVNWASIAKGVAGSDSFQVENPIGDIDAASESNNNFIVIWGISNQSIDTVAIIFDDLRRGEGNGLAEITVPIEDGGFWLIGDGWELCEFFG